MEELENIETTEESSSQLSFKLDGFEGPLDLLLHLIKEKNVSIQDVKISDITDQYLKYMENIHDLDMDEATAFLDMTSRLLEIKSKSLLPVEQTDEDEEEICLHFYSWRCAYRGRDRHTGLLRRS